MRTLAIVLIFAALCAHRAAAQANNDCSLSITSPLNFGTYTGTQIHSTSPYVVTCRNQGDGWYIPMDAGGGAGATETQRYLTGPNGVELAYEIYRDGAYSQNWGNNYPTTTQSGTGNYNGTIYAQLNANQVAPTGTYTDTVHTDTTQFTLTVVIQGTCTISANPLSFGNYTAALLNAASTLSVKCTSNIAYNVGLDAGTAAGATVTTRKMTGPAGALMNYSLYSNSTRTSNWGNTSPSWVSGTGTGAAQTLTVYGQIPANQHLTSGTYTDTITATVNY